MIVAQKWSLLLIICYKKSTFLARRGGDPFRSHFSQKSQKMCVLYPNKLKILEDGPKMQEKYTFWSFANLKYWRAVPKLEKYAFSTTLLWQNKTFCVSGDLKLKEYAFFDDIAPAKWGIFGLASGRNLKSMSPAEVAITLLRIGRRSSVMTKS